jgi:DNA polymerase-3 subunit gamma/tau
VATPSLYRRYRPRRFAEIKGQDHVVRALRDAVAGGREGQAYLFSGPRGTGKTTSARILAKVLNCERPVDGEPCCECASCLDVERGVSYDVHELDAASNNGVEAMRDLIEKANLGTPGRHKVYILDEVHMLSKPAEATLLKTLEEPPSHVVFVLATTDPQKVSDTIRSRTQHLRFHLLPPDVLADHVRWVAADAGLDVSADAIDAAVTQGAGSARDTLSALELIANAGGALGEELTFDDFLEAFIEHDPGRALTAMARLVNVGHDPRTIAEGLVKHLRNGFLCLMAPDLVQLPADTAEALAAQSQRLGPAALVAAIERLGEILVELRHSPDPRVLIEVTLVQLCRQRESVDDVAGLAARVAKLERAAAAPPTAPAPVDPTTGRAKLGGRAQQLASTPAAGAPASAPTPAPEPIAAAAASGGDDDLVTVWNDQVRPHLRGLTRALFAPVEVVAAADDVVTLSAPNPTHQAKCEQQIAEVERALREITGRPVTVRWESVSGGDPTPPSRPAPPSAAVADDHHEPDDSQPVLSGGPSVLERLSEAFPGATLVGEDD